MGWFGKKETGMVPVEQGKGIERAGSLVPVANDDDEIVIYNGPSKGMQLTQRPRQLVEFRSKSLKIDGKLYKVNVKQLIRMIRYVTQTIGEYKNQDNPYASYVISALRKARANMVADLENHFNITWEIDEATGRSIFYQ